MTNVWTSTMGQGHSSEVVLSQNAGALLSLICSADGVLTLVDGSMAFRAGETCLSEDDYIKWLDAADELVTHGFLECVEPLSCYRITNPGISAALALNYKVSDQLRSGE